MRELAEKTNKSSDSSRDLTPYNKMPNKKSVKRKILIFSMAVLAAAILMLAANWFLAGKDFRADKESAPDSKIASEQSQSNNGNENMEGEEAIGEEEKAADDEGKADIKETAMASENYKISQIKFGGDAFFLSSSSENIPLEIYDTRSETVSSKDGEEHKLMIVWKTNKLATSEVEYSESSGQNPKTVERSDYGFDHSAILSDLEPATAYVYRIKAQDRWGNESASDYFGAYTGKKADSVFELVVKAIEEVFGWAMKK